MKAGSSTRTSRSHPFSRAFHLPTILERPQDILEDSQSTAAGITRKKEFIKSTQFSTKTMSDMTTTSSSPLIDRLKMVGLVVMVATIGLQGVVMALNSGQQSNNLSSGPAGLSNDPQPEKYQQYPSSISDQHEFASQIEQPAGIFGALKSAMDPLISHRTLKSHKRHKDSRRGTDDPSSIQDWKSIPNDSVASAMLKTFIKSNSIRAYHLDLHAYRSEAPLEGDPEFVDSHKPSHQRRCAKHLSHFLSAVTSFNQLDPMLDKMPVDALRLADTFGRPEAGIFEGNQFWLGSYTGCKKASLRVPPEDSESRKISPNSDGDLIKSQYCIGVGQYPNWRPQDSEVSLKMGLCLPETCTSSMLNEQPELIQQVEAIVSQQVGGQPAFKRLKLRSIFCLPHETSVARQMTQSGNLFILFIGSFVLLSLLATAIDYVNSRTRDATTNALMAGQSCNIEDNSNGRNWRKIYVESFSIIRNVDKIMQVRNSPTEPSNIISTDDTDDITSERYDRSAFLGPMAGIKCIGLFWIIAAHTFLVSPIVSRNLLDGDELLGTFLANIYLSAHLMVDTFFTLSGLLASYFLFKEGIDKLKVRQWIIQTIHRYWRLTPIYLIAYWYTKSLGHLVGSGPLWDYKTAPSSPRLMCQNESWWEAILHMSDYKSPKEHCVPFAWFIANGIKFWLVTPFILVLIHKSYRLGYKIVAGAIMANMCVVAWLALRSNVDIHSVITLKAESANNMLNNMGEIYTRPYSRIGTYLIGLVAGHLLYLIERKQFHFRITNNFRIFAWTLFSLTLFLLTFIIKLAGNIELDHGAEPIVFSICSAVMRPIWALCTCWLVFALAHGQCKWLRHFLAHPIWQVIVKLSFCAYLFQGEVIALVSLAAKSTSKVTYADLLFFPMIIIPFVLVVSFLGTILLEYPLIGIEEILLPPRKQNSGSVSRERNQKTDKTIEKDHISNGKLDKAESKVNTENGFNHLPNGQKLKVM